VSFQVINQSSGRVVSSHKSEAAAWAAVDRIQRRVSRSLNKPGMVGGISSTEYHPLIVAEVLDG